MSTQFPNFHPSVWQVRVEITVDKGYPCPWRNAASVINCCSWDEALDETIRQGSEWLEAIHEECDRHYIRYNRTGPGSWIVEVIDAQAICPKKIRVDCEVYAGGDPLGDDDELTWYVASYRLVEEFGDTEPEPEPEPEEEIFDAAMVVIDRLGSKAEPEPEPEPEQYQPEDLMIPIPSWDWIDTSVETEPEPDRVTYGYLYVSIETPEWSCDGSTEFDLYNDAAEAANEMEEITERILWRIQDCLGIPADETKTASSEHWGQANDLCPWMSTTRYWEISPSRLMRVTVDWSTELNQVPRSAMIAEPVGHTEPLWFGVFKNEGIAVFADSSSASLALWAKGAFDAFSASENGVTYLTGLSDLETARKGKERGFYVYGSGVSAEGRRLV